MQLKTAFRNTLILLVMGFVLLSMYDQPVLALLRHSYPPEVRDFYDRELVPMDGEKFAALLKEAKGRPTLVFVYASWCPHCQTAFPAVDAIAALYPGEKLQTAYISLDQNGYDLSRYLMKRPASAPVFTPYQVGHGGQKWFLQSLEQYGLRPTGGIPYTLIFDGKGKPVAEIHRPADVRQLRGILQPLLQTAN